MTSPKQSLLKSAQAMNELRQRLEHCPIVSRWGHDEAGTLAHAFSDLEQSCRAFLDVQLPRLVDPNVTGEALEEVLGDLRIEFQHMLYHLHDPKLFRVVEPTHEWLTVVETPNRS